MNENQQNLATGGDINAFIEELTQPKHPFEQTESIFDALPSEPAPITAHPAEKITTQMTAGAANASGKLVVSVIDTVIPALQAWLAKSDSEEFKADSSDRAELENALSEYMKLKGGDIPPGVMCIILVLAIYGSNIPKMLELRKINTEKEKLEKMRRDLEYQRKQLDLEREKLKKQPENEQ
jgi:hypothetical protein